MSRLNLFQSIQETTLKSSLLERLMAALWFFAGKERETIDHIGVFDILTLGIYRLVDSVFSLLLGLGLLCLTGAGSLFLLNTKSVVANVFLFFLKLPILLPLAALGIVLCAPLLVSTAVWVCAGIAATIAVSPIVLLVHGIMKGVDKYKDHKLQKGIGKGETPIMNDKHEETKLSKKNSLESLNDSSSNYDVNVKKPSGENNNTNVSVSKNSNDGRFSLNDPASRKRSRSLLQQNSHFSSNSVQNSSNEKIKIDENQPLSMAEN